MERFAFPGNNYLDKVLTYAGISNYCAEANSALSGYISESMIKKERSKNLVSHLLSLLEINDIPVNVVEMEKKEGEVIEKIILTRVNYMGKSWDYDEVMKLLKQSIKGADVEILEEAMKRSKKSFSSFWRYIMSIIV